MSWMASARGAMWFGLCVVLAAGCGSSSSSTGAGGGDGGAGGVTPGVSCEAAVAQSTSACVTDVSGAWEDCYVDGGAPCATDNSDIASALAALQQSIADACEDAEFGSLSVQALTERAQVACSSESLSLASRTYGGPQGAVWASASGGDQDCLVAAHQSATAFIEGVTAVNNDCLEASSCDSASIDAEVSTLRDTAKSAIDGACGDLASLIAVNEDAYLDHAKYQADCVVATTHTETSGTNLSCGPTRAPDTLPRGEYFQVVLDEEVWGTRCGDGTEWAFQVRLAPEGEPIENVLVGMQGGGVCDFENDCRNIVENAPGLLEALSD